MRPTGPGAAVGVTGAAIYLFGVALGYPAVVMLGALLLLMLLAAVPWVLLPVRLEVERRLEPSQVERGRVAIAELRITTSKRRVAPTTAFDAVGSDVVEMALPTLRSQKAHRTTYTLPTAKRGAVKVGPLIVDRTDPLGLLRRRSVLGRSEVLTVFPRIHAMQTVSGGALLDLDEGVAAEQALEGAGSFHGLRPYLPGDDIRKIHWRTSARTRSLMVRKYVETEQPEITVLVDDALPSYGDAALAEEAIDVAASLMSIAGAKAVLRTLGGSSAVTAGEALRLLTGLQLAGEGRADASFAAAVPHDGNIVVITGAGHLPALRTMFDQQSTKHSLIFIVLARGKSQVVRSPGVVVIQGATAQQVAASWNASS